MEFKPLTNHTKSGPLCPNHGEPLEGLAHPVPAKGTGICPVSRSSFDYSINLDEKDRKKVKDRDGNITTIDTYTVTGDEDKF